MRLPIPVWLVLVPLLAGCSFTIPTFADPTRPDDFQITYEWQEGSLPPPYHYEYIITVSPAGEGEIVMVPDYDMNEPPTWTETFTSSSEEMDALYRTLVDNGLLTTPWRAQDAPPVGGSSQSLTAVASGRQIVIPTYVVPTQTEAAENIFAAVEAIVPQEIWDKLTAQREEYVKEHGG